MHTAHCSSVNNDIVTLNFWEVKCCTVAKPLVISSTITLYHNACHKQDFFLWYLYVTNRTFTSVLACHKKKHFYCSTCMSQTRLSPQHTHVTDTTFTTALACHTQDFHYRTCMSHTGLSLQNLHVTHRTFTTELASHRQDFHCSTCMSQTASLIVCIQKPSGYSMATFITHWAQIHSPNINILCNFTQCYKFTFDLDYLLKAKDVTVDKD